MSRWFRLYDEMLDDPKVQKLHPALFKVLVNVWCVASRHDGSLPSQTDLAFALRMSEDETFRAVSKLAELGFIDTDTATGEQHPHAWDQRQFRSDVSTDRVRAHREKRKTQGKPPPKGGNKVSASHLKADAGNADETFHATSPETDTETDYSVAKATGTVVPLSAAAFCKAVFDSAIPLLTASGKTDREARSIIGRWRKTCGDADLLTLIRQSETEQHMSPLEWIMAAVETRNGTRKPHSHAGGSRRSGLMDQLRESWAEEAVEDPAADQIADPRTRLALPSYGR